MGNQLSTSILDRNEAIERTLYHLVCRYGSYFTNVIVIDFKLIYVFEEARCRGSVYIIVVQVSRKCVRIRLLITVLAGGFLFILGVV